MVDKIRIAEKIGVFPGVSAGPALRCGRGCWRTGPLDQSRRHIWEEDAAAGIV